MSRKKKPLPTLLNVEIQDFAAEGKTVTRVRLHETDETPIVLFVPFAAPGDICDIRVTRKKHSYAEGEIIRIIKPSPLRVTPKCQHFGICGGCKWQQLDYDAQISFKQKQVEETLRRIAKIPLPDTTPILGADPHWEYRNKMEYTFSNKKWRSWEEIRSGQEFTDTSDALGFHIGGSFDKVLQIEKCWLQEDLGNRIRNFLYALAVDRGLSFYDIRNNVGLLRNIMIRIASTGEVMLIIVFGEKSDLIPAVMEEIASNFPEITSLGYIINLKLNDSIADQDVVSVKGLPYITERMENLLFRIHAKSFYQTNSRQAFNLYNIARDFAFLSWNNSENHRPILYDLYTGAGTIANFVARYCNKVIGIEYVEDAVIDARKNSELNGISNTEFYAGDMKDILTDGFITTHGHPDIMIIDPPRAGMHADVVKVILNAAPSVLVYVSCNPATQARDLALLHERYDITHIQPVDMFPHTQHVENVVRLSLRHN